MKLRIAHLYPDLLNLYGDIGNMTTLKKRCEWRDISVQIDPIYGNEKISFTDYDLVFLGGGSDREQLLVRDKLIKMKKELTAYVNDGGVLAAVCGGYQLLGSYYKLENETIEGLEILNIQTEVGKTRLISDVVIENEQFGTIVGFENHGGRTYINEHTPLGKVLYGSGNNGTDGNEGVIYKNVIATYLHGSLLPKNPKLADHIIKLMLEQRGLPSELKPLDDTIENNAHQYIIDRFVKK
ncbi:MAG: glutamine amidotransferase [Clostridia bacterium]|nr:glutamine amidotransferase [Clostridia bacterium]MBQ2152306.1 glutamine amidotransferase [Clostridia bacterium]